MANEEKSRQLGMPFGTANGRLRKMILFSLLKKLEENFCFRCGAEIESVDDLSIEHKKPWLHESVDLFWDLDNVAFSHLDCNIKDARPRPRVLVHGTETGYGYGCRCKECTQAKTVSRRLYARNT